MSKNVSSTQQTRFAVIESLLRWEGQISNRRLRQILGLKAVPVSRLIAAYRRAFPEVLREDRKYKRFVADREVKVSFAFGHLHEYGHYVLSQPNSEREFEDLTIDRVAIVPKQFALLRSSIEDLSWLLLTYHVRGAERPEQYQLRPQHLIRSILGWYLRAYVETTKSYATFNLGRIHAAQRLEPVAAQEPEMADAGWNKFVALRFRAHTRLSAADEPGVRREFFGGAAGRRISVRQCLAPIVLYEWRVAVDPFKQAPPDYQLELANAEELKKAGVDFAQSHL
ncbi:MAG: WYL domain-containing protein [Steroidobacteraceae bacterium]